MPNERIASPETGLTLIEVLVGLVLTLLLLMAAYDLLDSSNRFFVRHVEEANARASGRAALELMASDIRGSGYGPTGAPFMAVPDGNSTRIRLVTDLDGDGVVGVAGEADENVSWVFAGPTNGVYELRRGVDLDGDWSFSGTGESLSTIIEEVERIDVNGDGTSEPFLSYDLAPPAVSTRQVRVTFGVRSPHKNTLSRTYESSKFDGQITLRNRLP